MSVKSVTYVTLDLADLKHVVSDLVAQSRDDDILLDMAGVMERFNLSKPFVYSLIREGKITPHVIQGRPRVVRYSLNEIKSIFSTINSNSYEKK